MEKTIKCADCKHEHPIAQALNGCPKCGSHYVMNEPNAAKLTEAMRHVKR